MDPGKTLLVPILLATIVAVFISSLGTRSVYVATISALTALLATSAVSSETICLLKPSTSYHREIPY